MKNLFIIFIGAILLSCSNDKIIRVGIQPFGNFDSKIVDTVSITIQKKYGFKTIILNKMPLPKEAFINIKSPRYRADILIKYLKENKADTLDYIIGLTDYDISVTKNDAFGNVKSPKEKYSDWGIFGLGYRPGPSCIISSFRLHTNRTNFLLKDLRKFQFMNWGIIWD